MLLYSALEKKSVPIVAYTADQERFLKEDVFVSMLQVLLAACLNRQCFGVLSLQMFNWTTLSHANSHIKVLVTTL